MVTLTLSQELLPLKTSTSKVPELPGLRLGLPTFPFAIPVTVEFAITKSGLLPQALLTQLSISFSRLKLSPAQISISA